MISVSNLLKLYKFPILMVFACIGLYWTFGYNLDRSDFIKLLTLFAALFFLSWQLIKQFGWNFKILMCLGIIFRLIFFVAVPNLSQDFYRFLWDGRLLVQGVSPYLFTPEQFLNNLPSNFLLSHRSPEAWNAISISQSQELYAGMGDLNGSHYSNYPPVNQLCFAIAALFSGKSILGSAIVLRALLIMADIGILYFGKKLLERLKLPGKNIFWYFLNPFIIIELTGNLHFEGVMLFFMVWSLYLLHKGKWFWAAVLLGISVSVKLLPLLMLPLFYKWFFKKEVSTVHNLTSPAKFYIVVLGTVLLTFAPFLSSEFIENFSTTIGLWFQNFEFNASIYYLIRWIGFQTVGWNLIGTVGKILPVVVIFVLLALTFFRKNNTMQQLITGMLLGVSAYFLLSTTVHPWYVATPLVLSIFTKYKFPIVWSAVVILSYSAYGVDGFQENLWLVAVEYVIVISFAITEIISQSGDLKGNFRIVE